MQARDDKKESNAGGESRKEEKHTRKRRERSTYCVDCGEQLIE